MPKCKVCGTRLAEETTKCPSCGAAAGSTVAGAVSLGANLQKSLCPACNKQILGEHKYCPDCGADLQEAAKQAAALKPAQNKAEHATAQCVHCGTSLLIGAKFCSECGTPQTGNIEATTITKNVTTAKSAPNATGNLTLVSGQKETDIDAFEYEIQAGKYILTKLKDTSLTEVVIPRVFSEIRGYYDDEKDLYGAFSGCKNLQSVVIPDSVEVIGEEAFYGCENLQSVVIPDSVKEIGDWAFARCKSLESVTILDSVKVIGEEAFYGCENLQSVTILDSVKVIGDRAFARCKSLQHITIPHSVEVIGEEAFYGCENLQSVTIRNPQFSKSDINRIFKGTPNLYGVEVGNKIIKTSLVTRIGSEDTIDILKAIFIGPQ